MLIRFFAHHLLHWKPLIPVILECVRRGHHIIIETSRPNWLGMPRFSMAYHPQYVTGINAASLAWVADLIGYGAAWAQVQPHLEYVWMDWRWPRWYESCDVAVSTVKALAGVWPLAQRDVAIGYQHFPAIVVPGEERSATLPPAFLCPPHPFAERHRFGELLAYGRTIGCGFPHLDRVRATPLPSRNVLFCHPGMARGCTNNKIIERAIAAIQQTHTPIIAAHPMPGTGGTWKDLEHQFPGVQIVQGWWPAALRCQAVITLGSSSLYELWAAGYHNTFVLAGTPRSDAFALFPDLCIPFPGMIPESLKRGVTPSPLTDSVMRGFEALHMGNGAIIAADVIEGRR